MTKEPNGKTIEYFEDKAMYYCEVNIDFLYKLISKLAKYQYDNRQTDFDTIDDWINYLSGEKQSINVFLPNFSIAAMLDKIGYTDAAESWRTPHIESKIKPDDPNVYNIAAETHEVAKAGANIIINDEIYDQKPAKSNDGTLINFPIPEDCPHNK